MNTEINQRWDGQKACKPALCLQARRKEPGLPPSERAQEITPLLASLPAALLKSVPTYLQKELVLLKTACLLYIHVPKEERVDICVTQLHLRLEDEVRWIVLFVLKSIRWKADLGVTESWRAGCGVTSWICSPTEARFCQPGHALQQTSFCWAPWCLARWALSRWFSESWWLSDRQLGLLGLSSAAASHATLSGCAW